MTSFLDGGSASVASPDDYISSLPATDHSMIENHIISIPRQVDLMLSHKCCIYKVPEPLRKVKPEAYAPQLISIGPFHFNNKMLKPMETQKQVYFHYFWNRLRSKGQDFALQKLTEYKDFLVKNEQEISYHYSEKIDEIINDGENDKGDNEIYSGENNKQNNEIINDGENNKQDKLVSIILLDSVFVMELFLRNRDPNKLNDDYMFTKSWLHSGIQRDLLLLENQLPFFVLEKLYELVSPSFNGPSFIDLALNYFHFPIQTNYESRLTNVRHFTDLVRRTFRPSCPKFSPYESKVQMSVTKLKKAGITFENAQEKLSNKKDLNLQDIRVLLQQLNIAGKSTARLEDLIAERIEEKARASRRNVDDPAVQRLTGERETPEGVENLSMIPPEEVEKLVKLKMARVSFKEIQDISLLDVKFDKADFLDRLPCLSCLPYPHVVKARLQIPQFRVDDSTEYIFRNLIAYEQCHDHREAYVCNYVYLLDSLIDTEEDVDLLVQSKIIDHMLGSNKELAELINNLCKNLVIANDCYSHVIKRLDKHYSNGWNSSIATLRSVYFPDLWRTSSTVVGVAVLVLTIVSLVRSVFS